MSGAIIRNGCWRRRDALEGLSQPMRAALILADRGLALSGGVYRPTSASLSADARVSPATVRALAVRGLLRLSAGAEGRLRRFALTAPGHAVVAEIRRRANVRAKLERESRAAYQEARR